MPGTIQYYSYGTKCSFVPGMQHGRHAKPISEGEVSISNNPRDGVEGIIRQYSLSLRRIIALV